MQTCMHTYMHAYTLMSSCGLFMTTYIHTYIHRWVVVAFFETSGQILQSQGLKHAYMHIYIYTYSDFHNDCLFFSTKKNYIDTERWEQRPKRFALAPEFELEFFFWEKKRQSLWKSEFIHRWAVVAFFETSSERIKTQGLMHVCIHTYIHTYTDG